MQTTSLSLLAQVKACQNEAWEHFYALYEPLIRSWVMRDRIARLEAEDLVQDVILSVRMAVADFERRREGSFRKWLRVIAANRVAQFLRRCRPEQAGDSLFAKLADNGGELEREWDAEYDRHVARQLLELVRPEFGEAMWEIFDLTEFQGVSPGEAARRLNVSAASIYKARNRVFARLREIGDQILEK